MAILVLVLTGDMVIFGIAAVIACPEGFSLPCTHQDTYFSILTDQNPSKLLFFPVSFYVNFSLSKSCVSHATTAQKFFLGIALATAVVVRKHAYTCGHFCVGPDRSVKMFRVGIVAIFARPEGSSLRLS